MTSIASSTARSGASAALPRHWSFVVALWVALSTALLCALPSGGLPSSKTIGSAFDPATTSVALRTRATDRVATIVARDRAPDPVGSSSGAPAAIVAALPVAPSASGTRQANVTSPVAASALPHSLLGIAQPRGPPAV